VQERDVAHEREADAKPPARREAEVSACVKRSKTCGRNSGAMPMPLSFTWSCTRSAFLCRSTLIVPPSGVNFTAFDSRLDTSCCSRPASPITMVAGSSGAKRRSTCFAVAPGRAASSVASNRVGEVHHAALDGELAADDARGVEQIVDQPRLVVDVALDRLGGALDERFVERVRRRHQVAPAAQRVERRAQLVRDDGEELVLRPLARSASARSRCSATNQLLELALRVLPLGDVGGDARSGR